MFKFDFQVDSEDAESPFKTENTQKETDISSNNNNKECAATSTWYESEEVLPKEDLLDNLSIYELNAVEKTVGNLTINYAACGFLLENISKDTESNEKNDIAKSEKNHSDLLPGIYEGGAKIWECTDDLLKYLLTKYAQNDWQHKRVLDLGCGAGLLGIYVLKCGAEVHFQDYNEDVLHNVTIPNVILNVELTEQPTFEEVKEKLSRVKFFSGDWEKYAKLTKDEEKFDFILTSETIYNPENQQKLLNTFSERLKTDGTVLVAGKVHYFGVGGGVRQFESLIDSDNRFTRSIVDCNEEASVVREILMLNKKYCLNNYALGYVEIAGNTFWTTLPIDWSQ